MEKELNANTYQVAEQENAHPKHGILRSNRFEALVDGIFAIAMTILVLELKIPEHLTNVNQVVDALYANLFNYINFVVAFIVLASLWLNNLLQFHCCKQTDKSHIFLNMMSLMFVSVVPFSTSLIGDYPDSFVCVMIFHLNQLMIAAFYFFSWNYLHCQEHLKDTECDETISTRRGMISTLIYFLITLVAIIVAFFSPRWSTLCYALLPLAFFIKSKIKARKEKCKIKPEIVRKSFNSS